MNNKMKIKNNWLKENKNLLILLGVIGLMIIIFFNKDISKEGVSIPKGGYSFSLSIINVTCYENFVEVYYNLALSGDYFNTPIELEIFNSNNESLGVDLLFDFSETIYSHIINSTNFALILGEIYTIKMSMYGRTSTMDCVTQII